MMCKQMDMVNKLIEKYQQKIQDIQSDKDYGLYEEAKYSSGRLNGEESVCEEIIKDLQDLIK